MVTWLQLIGMAVGWFLEQATVVTRASSKSRTTTAQCIMFWMVNAAVGNNPEEETKPCRLTKQDGQIYVTTNRDSWRPARYTSPMLDVAVGLFHGAGHEVDGGEPFLLWLRVWNMLPCTYPVTHWNSTWVMPLGGGEFGEDVHLRSSGIHMASRVN